MVTYYAIIFNNKLKYTFLSIVCAWYLYEGALNTIISKDFFRGSVMSKTLYRFWKTVVYVLRHLLYDFWRIDDIKQWILHF